jgi:hypothetical protein
MAEGSLVDSLASGWEKRASGKHRTEVTEATEGIEGLRLDGGRFFGGQLGFWAGKTRTGKAPHRGHGVIEGE